MPILTLNEAKRNPAPSRPQAGLVRGKPLIAVTMGDPAGIGPEVTLKALASLKDFKLADFFIIGDGRLIERLKERLAIKIDLPIMDVPNVSRCDFACGEVRAHCGKAAMEYIDKAIELAKSKKVSAIVTAPVNKAAIRLAGYKDFLGHTEYLARKTSAKDFAMMFVGRRLKITLVTRHIALGDVPKKLSSGAIVNSIYLTRKYIREFFGMKSARIGVAGLNPHAGEGGAFGKEEIRLITPAIKKASRLAKDIVGPIPPDVIFHEAYHGKYDAVVSMYHDQALIPFKLLYFRDGVNLTLGLDFIRTSPDHGTAFEIAGRFSADPRSMIEAMRLAARLASNHRNRGRKG